LILRSLASIRAEMERIGVYPAGIEHMVGKGMDLAIKVHQVKFTAANIIKQEMLSLGGDAAVARGVIDGTAATSDIILLGTLKQLSAAVPRLRGQPFGLRRIAEAINRLLPVESEQRKFLLRCGKKTFDLCARTHLMGVVNVTPDSFSDGGQFADPARAGEHALELVAAGADIVDIGGESTRPGALPVSVGEELGRILPVIEEVARKSDAPISVDTYKADVADAALSAGAAMVNDISALRFDPRMVEIVASRGAPVVLMHMKGTPRNMQTDPRYDDVLDEVFRFLAERVGFAQEAGIGPERIVVDPGIGFGKRLRDNLVLLNRIGEFSALGCPVLVGPSRKSFIGTTLDLPVDERLEGTAAAVAVAIVGGAHIVRVHDVKEMSRVARMVDAIVRAETSSG
jgi:dihydropteroate synthase